MPLTYVAIQTITVGAGGQSAITFSSIPSTYTDLLLIASLRDERGDASVTDTKLTFNGTTTGYNLKTLIYAANSVSNANVSATSSITAIYENSDLAVANGFSPISIYIPNYTSSNNKAVNAESFSVNNNSTVYGAITTGLWTNSAAVSSITLAPAVAVNYKQNSTATLYGIKNS